MSTLQTAEQAVGQDDETSDWELRPERHAGGLPSVAGALRRILLRPEVGSIVSDYIKADTSAGTAQQRYKAVGRLGLYTATVASVVGAAFLLPIETFLAPIRPFVSAIQVSALCVAFLASRLLVKSKPFDSWMQQRGVAELARAALFDTVSKAQEPSSGDELPSLPLRLEYFRRYQLDVQRRYYRGRGAQHQAAVWRNNKWLSVSVLVTALAGVAGTIVALQISQPYVNLPAWLGEFLSLFPPAELNRVILALGVVASSFYGLGTARSLMDLDERNASRFRTTSANLEYLVATGLENARSAAAAGREDDVLRFIERVQQQISSEHREWVILANMEQDPERLTYVMPRAQA